MTATISSSSSYRSSRGDSCPVCGRNSDGDCEIFSDGRVFCHRGSTFAPPEWARVKGDHGPGADGKEWAYLGESDRGTAMFKPHRPLDLSRPSTASVIQLRPRQQAPQPAPLPPGPVLLARLPDGVELPDLDRERATYSYGQTQQTRRNRAMEGKVKPAVWGPTHPEGCERVRQKARENGWKEPNCNGWILHRGDEPWPMYQQALVLEAGGWVVELEGERCAALAMDGGLVATCQPGHDHTGEAITRRYRALAGAGVAIAYVSDNDVEGQRKAERCAAAAATAGLPFVHLPAAAIWPGIPEKGSIDDAGDPVEAVAAIEAALQRHLQPREAAPAPSPEEEPKPTARSGKRVTLAPDEILALLPHRIGAPRLNIRTRDVHLPDRILSGDETARFYLELSNSRERWLKEPTADAVQHLAARAQFDPALEELERITATAEPLPMEEWNRLDLAMFNISDPIAAAFLPRYLIGAVARLYRPGCQLDQTPVLIGPQGIGKTQTGRVLFGAAFFGDGLTHRFDVDDVTRLQRVWALELSEVDGITRRSDQEALKAFLTRQTDIERRKYGRSPEGIPRRSVFWGTSNGAPLRDLSGSRRFVCIPLPAAPLPLDAIAAMRPPLWARAVEQYRAGVPWFSPPEEAAAITQRNADHQQVDPWAEELAEYLERKKAAAPIKTGELLTFLEVPKDRRTPVTATRLRQVMEALGWEQRRPQVNGRRVLGFYPKP